MTGLHQRADRFTDLVERLSHQSVVRHFDAYADVPWDDAAYRIDPADPRWELPDDSALGATAWYRSQPAEVRARMGLHGIAANMKAGLQFESILTRGLLEYAFRLPDHSPEFRYAYHEVIEEAQHSLMFQEFVNRAGLDVPGLTWDLKLGARRVIAMARHFPALFFVFVLGGEDPIDHVQRTSLRSGRELHRSSNGSCGSTSPRKRDISRSLANICARTCRRSSAGNATSSRSKHP